MSSDTAAASDDDASHVHHDRHARCCEGKFANILIQVTQSMMCTPLAVLWIIMQGRQDGINHEGNVSTEIYDYIPYKHRMFIIINLNLNCIFQYINQTFRAIYWTFEEAEQHVLEVNLFFALSFLCALIAPIHQYRMEQQVRKEGKAPPGEELSPIEKFMQRTDFTYREMGVESYDYAMRQLQKHLKWQAEKKQPEKDDQETDRTATAGESQLSLYANSAVDMEANAGSNGVLSTRDCVETRANPEVSVGESSPA